MLLARYIKHAITRYADYGKDQPEVKVFVHSETNQRRNHIHKNLQWLMYIWPKANTSFSVHIRILFNQYFHSECFNEILIIDLILYTSLVNMFCPTEHT